MDIKLKMIDMFEALMETTQAARSGRMLTVSDADATIAAVLSAGCLIAQTVGEALDSIHDRLGEIHNRVSAVEDAINNLPHR